MLWWFRVKGRSGSVTRILKFLCCFQQGGHFRQRRLLVSSCWSNRRSSSWRWTGWKTFCGERRRREGRRLRAVEGGSRVLHLRRRIGGQPEHHDCPAAEDALWRATEKRGGARQSGRAAGDRPADHRHAAGLGRWDRRNGLPAGPTGDPADEGSAAPAKNHGRNGADAYTGAEAIEVRHESLQPGDPCPKCDTGTVYTTNRQGVLGAFGGPDACGGEGILSGETAL